MKRTALLVAVALFLTACTKIDYVGQEYPPTTHVDLYFSLDDIEKEYEVMGHLVATADEMVSAEKMQEDMLKKAREKGADAIVILGLERYAAGGSSTYTETRSKEKNKETTIGKTTTSSEEKKEIRATLLKYK